MPFELTIALRYLLAKRRQVFISVITLVSTLGVTVGVMALVIALAVMTGLQQELRDRLLGNTAHVYVWKRGGISDYHADIERLKKVPCVVSGAPVVPAKSLINSYTGEGFASSKGIYPALETQVTDIATALLEGSVNDLNPRSESDDPGILLGRDLATELGASL